MDSRPTIAIIGSGNVATHLSLALDKVAEVRQVYSRNFSNAAALASRLRCCVPISKPDDMDRRVDFCIVSVSDASISKVAEVLPEMEGIVAHTSGSVPMQALSGVSDRIGVFYPLQTFSRDVKVDISEVPFFIEGSDGRACETLKSLASKISGHVYEADSHQRAKLHISAVFACNFVNHLWSIASSLLASSGYDFSVMRPLLQATLDKALAASPYKGQTGPAVRGDVEVMRKQMASLEASEREIYRLLSQAIINKHLGENSIII